MSAPEGMGSLMSPAEMKPLLLLSKREPVSAVIGLTKGKDGLVLLDKRMKPRKLVAQLKKKAADAKIELDMTSVRFGRATVDTAVDSALVTFTVNKDAAGALKPKLLTHLKKAGFSKCEIVVDASLENEEDNDAMAAHDARPLVLRHPCLRVTTAQAHKLPPRLPTPPATPGEAPLAEAAGAPAGIEQPGVTADASALPVAEQPDRAELMRRITDDVKRMMPLIAANPPGADAMRTAALAAQTALKSGDMDAAAHAADTLDRLLAASSGAGAAVGTLAAAKPANPAVYDKAQAAWVATRAKVQGEFDKLFAEISAVYDGHSVVAELEKSFHAQVQPTMTQLDHNLSDKLRELSANPDPSAHPKLVQEAQQIIVSYEQITLPGRSCSPNSIKTRSYRWRHRRPLWPRWRRWQRPSTRRRPRPGMSQAPGRFQGGQCSSRYRCPDGGLPCRTARPGRPVPGRPR